MTLRSHGSSRQVKTLYASECISTFCLNGPRWSLVRPTLTFTCPCLFNSHNPRSMSSQAPLRQVWHVSRDIVFAGGNMVVYPQLPSVRHSSTSAASLNNESSPSPLLGRNDRLSASNESSLQAQFITATAKHESPSAGPAVISTLRDQTLKEAGDSSEGPGSLEECAVRPVVDEETVADETVSLEPPFTPLDFKIPDAAFREAKTAAADSPESFWSYSLYRGPHEEGSKPDSPPAKVKVHYCRSAHTMERVIKQYFMDEPVVGFDLEWAPNATAVQGPRRNVSLMQLASPSRVALFHLSLFPKGDELVTPSLKELMGNPAITKVGVWIKGDANRMKKFLKVDSRGLFELSHLFRLVKFSATEEYEQVNKKLVSLATQVEEYLRLPMFKGSNVRESDWSKPLQMSQIIYAASDAYAGVQLYSVMDHLRQSLEPVPPLPYHAELDKPIRLAKTIAITEVEEAVEEEALDNGPEKSPELTTKFLESVGETIRVEAEGDLEEPMPKESRRIEKTVLKSTKDERIIEAESWLGQYRVSHPTMRAMAPAMRAYYIWHENKGWKPQDVAALLRNPPLQTSTIINYVLEAIRLEKLPFDKARLKADVLDQLPQEVATRRYKTLIKACEDESSMKNM